jgi:ArsR family transcriptional regulator
MKKTEDFELCARRLKALADPKRLRIVACLFSGTKNVGDLAAQLDDEIVLISHHLGVLRNAGLVQAHKSGRFVEYALHPDVVRAAKRSEQPKFIDLGCCRLDLGDE